MATKIIPIKCPACGANISYEEGRKKLFCSYCGTQINITNDNEFFYHHIDEAEVKQAETDQMVKLRKMELEEKLLESSEKVKPLKIKLSIGLGIIGAIGLIVGFSGEIKIGFMFVGYVCLLAICLLWAKEIDGKSSADGKILVPEAIAGYKKKNYLSIEAIFKSAGFTNIQCVPLKDLHSATDKAFRAKNLMVESISINGDTVYPGRGKYDEAASIVISYHSIS